MKMDECRALQRNSFPLGNLRVLASALVKQHVSIHSTGQLLQISMAYGIRGTGPLGPIVAGGVKPVVSY